jgi:uncharacterized membrane protein YuzA (DUF378 family)
VLRKKTRPAHIDDMWKEQLALVALTVTAIPIALIGMAGALSQAPPEFASVAEVFGPTLTSVCWALAGLTALLCLISIALQRKITNTILDKKDARGDEKKEKSAKVGAFLIAASITQIPPLLAVSLYAVGAGLAPVLTGVLISSAAVCVLGARM